MFFFCSMFSSSSWLREGEGGGGRKGRREGGKEGRREGGKEGRKEEEGGKEIKGR